jgi:rod shape-determining protein MreC
VARRGARGDVRLDAALLAGALILGATAMALPPALSDAVAGWLRGTVLTPLVAAHARAERVRHALAANDSTSRIAGDLVLRAFSADGLAQENERLRKLLALGERPGLRYVAAEALHTRSLGEEHILVLTAGTEAGVEPFSPVVSAEGIVGYVRSADRETSVAIVWPHPDFRVSVTTEDGAVNGIVSAHSGDGPAGYLLELRGVSFRTPLRIGTRVVSSGLGGTFPRGIPIGDVVQQLATSEGWERTYLVEPAVRTADVATVLILLRGGPLRDISAAWPRDSAASQRRDSGSAR